jgi:hypothetical protein
VPSIQKVREVLLHATRKKASAPGQPEGPLEVYKIDKKTAPQGVDYRVFRTAVAFCLPKLDLSSSISMEKQLATCDDAVTNSNVLVAFKQRQELVDAVYKAYAAKVAVAAKAAKAKPIHFQMERNKVLSCSIQPTSSNSKLEHEYVDARGSRYSSYGEIPKVYLEFISGQFNYKLNFAKRKELDAPTDDRDPKQPKVVLEETSAMQADLDSAVVEETPLPPNWESFAKRWGFPENEVLQWGVDQSMIPHLDTQLAKGRDILEVLEELEPDESHGANSDEEML